MPGFGRPGRPGLVQCSVGLALGVFLVLCFEILNSPMRAISAAAE